MKKTRLATLVAASSIVLLSACGGGGGSSNTPTPTPTNSAPQAKNDALVLSNGESAKVDVLANDTDANGDTLSITAITSMPSFGSAEIVDGQIQYTPTDPYMTGQDTLVYQVSDGESTASASVSLSLTQRLSLSGKASGANMPGATITATNGSQTETTTIDAQGNYSLTLSVEDSSQTVTLTATSADGFSQQISLLESLDALFEGPAADRTLDNNELPALNLSYLSTADYLLESTLSSPEQGQVDAKNLNIQRRMELAGFIKLMAESEEYAKPEGEQSLVSFLQSDKYQNAEDAMGQHLRSINRMNDKGQLEYYYKADLSTSRAVIAQQESSSSEFDFRTLIDKTVLLSSESRQGYLAPSGALLTLNNDGTGSYNKNLNSVLPASFTWQIADNKLVLNYLKEDEGYPTISRLSLGNPWCPDYCSAYQEVKAEFGEETADLLLNNEQSLPSGQFQLITRDFRRTLSAQLSDTGKVRLVEVVEREREIVLPEQIRPEAGNPKANILFSTYYELTPTYASLLADYDEAQMAGSWAIPIQQGDSPYAGMTADVVEITSTSATAKYANTKFAWQLNAGVLTLQGDNYTYDITPIKAEGDEWLAIINRYEDEQLIFTKLQKMAKFSDSATNFEQHALTEIPMVLFKQYAFWDPSSWSGDLPKPSALFGHQLMADGHARRGIAVYDVPIGEGSLFGGGGVAWTWTKDGNKVEIASESTPRRRTWDIVSVSDDGTILVLERRYAWIPDVSPEELWESSLTTYKAYDLSSWPEIWANSEF